MPLSPAVAPLLVRYHAAKPVRVWSLIVTLYGDAVVPRGGSLWIGSLIEIMALFGIDAGHVRTAISRLSADGWLDRVRRGRNSYYRLSKQGEGAFLAATRRIYSGDERPADGRLRLALFDPAGEDRGPLRSALATAGFVPLSPMVYVGAAIRRTRSAGSMACSSSRRRRRGSAGDRRGGVEDRSDRSVDYRAFLDRFAPLDAALATRKALAGRGCARCPHAADPHFRRIVLRDPELPRALLPRDWPGGAGARACGAHLCAPGAAGGNVSRRRRRGTRTDRCRRPMPLFGRAS